MPAVSDGCSNISDITAFYEGEICWGCDPAHLQFAWSHRSGPFCAAWR